MTIEELINKLGLAEVSKVDRQLLDHLLHLCKWQMHISIIAYLKLMILYIEIIRRDDLWI